MLEHIFGSKTRVKLLGLFLSYPNETFYVRELTRRIGAQIHSVRRELENLGRCELIVPVATNAKEPRGNRRYYRANPEFLLFNDLQALFVKGQVLLEQDFVRKIERSGRLQYLLLTGKFVGVEAPTDVLLVGVVNRNRLARIVAEFERAFGGEVNFTIMTRAEFQYRKDIADRFLYDLLEKKHVVVLDRIGSEAVAAPARHGE
ncbi:MAG: hypothetical protein AAB562_00175 [Patescibacteria group bacterium]